MTEAWEEVPGVPQARKLGRNKKALFPGNIPTTNHLKPLVNFV